MNNANHRLHAGIAALVVSLSSLGGRALAAPSGQAASQLNAQAAAFGIQGAALVPLARAQAVTDGSALQNDPQAVMAALFATPKTLKTFVKCDYGGEHLTVPIQRWETGYMVTKDATGNEVRQSYQYPIIDLGNFRQVGDGQLCWQVCHEACDGYGACWLSCTYHCTNGGGEGDPRRKG